MTINGGASNVRWLQIGEPTNNPDYASSISTWKFIDPQGEIDCPADQTKIPITAQSDDGEETAPVLGIKTGSVGYNCLLRGTGTACANGETPGAPHDLKYMLDSATGFTGQTTNALTSGSSHSTTVINVSSTSGFYDGASSTQVATGILMANTSTQYGTIYQAREVESIGASPVSLTVERAFDNAPSNSALVHTAQSWFFDPDATARQYAYFKAEGPNWARRFDGCTGGFKLTLDGGGLAMMRWDWVANDWADIADSGNTWATAGGSGGILVEGCNFYYSGASALTPIRLELEAKPKGGPQTAISGMNGIFGHTVAGYEITLAGSVYYTTDTVMNNFQSATTLDMAFQVGSKFNSATLGSAAYFRIPAFSGEAKRGTHAGLDTIEFSGKAYRPTAAQGKGALRVHIFGKAPA